MTPSETPPPRRRAPSIALKFFIALVPTTLFLIGLLGLSNFYTARRQILGGVEREIQVIAGQAAKILSSYFDQRQQDAIVLSEAPLLQDYLRNADFGLKQEAESYRKELSLYYSNFARRSGAYSRIAFVDRKGHEVAVGTPSGVAEPGVDRQPLPAEAAPGRVYDTGIAPGQQKAIRYWTAVLDDRSRLAGRVVLNCELDQVRRVLDGMRVGTAGRALLVDAKGDELLAARPPFPGALVAEAPIAGSPWKVRLNAQPQEFLMGLRVVQRWGLLGCLAAGLLLTLWIGYSSRKVTRPIEEMAEGTRRIAAGELDFRFFPPRIKELRILGDAFNDMALSLKERNRDLEARIRELTALRDMEGAVIQRLDEETVLRAGLKAVATGLSLDRTGLYWVDMRRKEIVGRYTHGSEAMGLPEAAFRKRRIALGGDDILNEVIRTRRSVLVKEPRQPDPRLTREFVEESKTEEFVMAPIHGKDRVFGVLVADNCYSRRALTESDKDGLTLFANAVGLALENATLFQHLADSEARYRSVLENSPVAILGLSAEQWIETWNRGAEQMFGYTAAEIVGKPLRALLPVSAADEHARLMGEVMEKGFVREFALPGMTKAGKPLDLTVSWGGALPDFWMNKEWTVVIRDVTEARKLQQQVIRSEKLSAVGQLISGITHELNNPLQAVVGYAQLLAKEPKSPFHRDLRMILDSAVRCRRIIDNLLVFVRQGKIERRPVKVAEAVKASLELLNYKLKKVSGVSVRLDLPKGVPRVLADFQQLEQVIVNLVNNACDAMAANSGPKQLRIGLSKAPAGVRLEVSDNGPGIPPESRERLFEPFFSTKPEGRGTGLGLAISRQMINDHGGRIGFVDGAEGGTTFWIELPAEPASAAPAPRAARAIPRIKPRSILVIDDEPAVLGVVSRVLRADGHRVDVAASYRQAAEKAARMSYDLVVMDVQLGDGNGLDFHENWTHFSPQPKPRFLLMTGDVLNSSVEQAVERRGLTLLGKPVDLQELRRAAHSLLVSAAPKASGSPRA